MYDQIENDLPQGPEWYSQTVCLPDTPHEPTTLLYRDIIEGVQYIVGDPLHKDAMDYAAVKIYELADEDDVGGEAEVGDVDPGLGSRVYMEMNSSRIWQEEQVRCR
jgi:hypothetical protein